MAGIALARPWEVWYAADSRHEDPQMPGFATQPGERLSEAWVRFVQAAEAALGAVEALPPGRSTPRASSGATWSAGTVG